MLFPMQGLRSARGMASLILAAALALAVIPVSAADLAPVTYSSLFSRSRLVAYGTVTGVSSGLFSDGRKAKVEVEGLYKGRLWKKDIEVVWKDEDHPEAGFTDGAKVILFLNMRKDSTFAQTGPGVSCWPVEMTAFKSGRPVKAVSYEFPLDLVSGIPKGAIRETEVVEKSLNFQVPKRKRWILVDALLPHMKAYKPPKPKPAKKPKPQKQRKKGD
jgi:hypothetical protein